MSKRQALIGERLLRAVYGSVWVSLWMLERARSGRAYGCEDAIFASEWDGMGWAMFGEMIFEEGRGGREILQWMEKRRKVDWGVDAGTEPSEGGVEGQAFFITTSSV